MLTTMSFRDEAPYCLDDDGEELSIEDILRTEREFEEENSDFKK